MATPYEKRHSVKGANHREAQMEPHVERAGQGAVVTGERLGGTSDPRARSAQEEGCVIVISADYRTGEKAAGTSSLFSCRIGRTPAWGGHAPPPVRAASRTRARSFRSL